MGKYRLDRLKYIGLACSLAFGLLLGILLGLSHPRHALASAQDVISPQAFPDFPLGITYLVTNTHGIGAGSLRQAIFAANANPGADTILFDIPGCAPKTPCVISLATPLPVITDTLTISGSGATSLIIDANNSFRGLRINAAPVIIADLTIRNGNTSFAGGGIYSTGVLTLVRVHLLNNYAQLEGGGVYAAGGLLVTDGYSENNVAVSNGGGLYSGDGLGITNTVVFSNAALSGGGAYAAGAAWINSGNFAENSSTEYGGGFYAMAPITLTNTAFVSNTANINGGGLYASDMLSIDKGRFENNHGFRGGGLHAIDSMTITQTYFISNSAGLMGGGFATYGAWTVIGSTFEANQAQRGGGIYVYDGVGLAVNTLFARNEAILGSALFLAGQSTAIVHSTVAGIPGTGSGISTYASTSSLALVNSILAHHDVAIENTAGPVIQDYNLFFDNTTDILGSYSGGANNQSGDPHFLDPDAGDYRLSRGSAAIDAGFDSGIPVDFEDEARPLGSGADIGFDEANLITGLAIAYTPNPAFTLQSPITFTASITTGDAVSYTWDFGDGSQLQVGNPLNHTYLSAGTYPVTVTAASAIDSLTATVALNVGSLVYFPLVVR